MSDNPVCILPRRRPPAADLPYIYRGPPRSIEAVATALAAAATSGDASSTTVFSGASVTVTPGQTPSEALALLAAAFRTNLRVALAARTVRYLP